MNTVVRQKIRASVSVWLLMAAAHLFAGLLLDSARGADVSDTNALPAMAPMTAARLLDLYAATQYKVQKLGIYVKYEHRLDGEDHLPPPRPIDGSYTRYQSGEKWWDGVRYAHRDVIWGNLFGNIVPMKEDASPRLYLFDGARGINYGWSRKKNPSGSGTVATTREATAFAHVKISGDAVLMGYLEDRERVDAILRRGTGMTFSRERDAQGKLGSYVLGAKTKNGRYTVWFDPDHDYQIAGAEIHRQGGDDFGGSKPLPPGFTADFSLKVTQFQQLDSLWLPMEATWTSHRKQPAGYYARHTIHLKRTEVKLSPDFKASHAFEPHEVRDGASFLKDGQPGYIWQKGSVVPGQAPSTRRSK